MRKMLSEITGLPIYESIDGYKSALSSINAPAVGNDEDIKEQLRFCLDTIIKCSREDISSAIRRQVVNVEDVKKAFDEYFDVKETEQPF